MQFNERDKTLTTRILAKVETLKQKNKPLTILDFKTLDQLLTKEEKMFVRRIMRINPRTYNFKGPYYGLSSVPSNIVIVRNQRYRRASKVKIIPPQVIPKNVYLSYKNLINIMREDIGNIVLIDSGYRSPAYQLIIFLLYLKYYKWNLPKTVKRVALPGYSEHGYPHRQALDFITKDGIPTEKDPLGFTKTPEYYWLLENATRFGFHLSYTPHNKLGIIFEPWHWSFKKRHN